MKSIAQIYQVKNNFDRPAIRQTKLRRALETKSSKKIAASAQLLQNLYAQNKNYEQAFTYLSVFVKHEALQDLENQKKVAAVLAARYETEKKELENKNLKIEKTRQALEIKQQQITLVFGVVVVVVMLILLLLLYRSRLHLKAPLQVTGGKPLLQGQHVKISHQKNELAAQGGKTKNAKRRIRKT